MIKVCFSWMMRHKVLAVLAAVCIICLASWAGYSYYQYKQKFSLEDYTRLTAMAETVLRKSGGQGIKTYRSCSYEHPSEMFSTLHLYCRVELVTYLPYNSSANAASIAKRAETAIKNVFGREDFPFSRFYQKTENSSDTATINLSTPFPKEQCNFYIHSNQLAKNAVSFLPEKPDDNLLAISFECSAESQAEFFPVTYRQG